MGIHKYGPYTSSSQLGIKSLGTRIPKTVGPGLCYKLCEICAWKDVYGKRRTLGLENITLGVRRTR